MGARGNPHDLKDVTVFNWFLLPPSENRTCPIKERCSSPQGVLPRHPTVLRVQEGVPWS